MGRQRRRHGRSRAVGRRSGTEAVMRIRRAPSRNPGDCLHVPYGFAERSTEEAIDDWIGGRIEGRQTLYEGSDCDIRLSLWHMPVNLKEVEDYVWTPAKDKY